MGAVLGAGGLRLFYGFERFAAIRCIYFASGRRHVVSRRISRCVGCHGAVRSPLQKRLSYRNGLLALCPIGLGLGRLGNFINMELPGRVTDSSLGLVFQCQACGT